MAWEFRPHRSPRYTRSHKVQGRVIREYVGIGQVGELAAAEDAERRAERQRHRDARRAEQACRQAALQPFLEFEDVLDQLLRGSLLVSGFHQHAHSEWRLRRAHPGSRA